MTKIFPTLSRNQVFEPLGLNDFWKNVKVKLDAVKYVRKLYEDGFQLYICTNSNPVSLEAKLKCIIDTWFPYIDRKHIIVTANKQLIKLDILVDDNPENLIHADYYGILVDRYHNKNFNCEAENISNKPIIRCQNWQEIYNTIHTIKNMQDLQ